MMKHVAEARTHAHSAAEGGFHLLPEEICNRHSLAAVIEALASKNAERLANAEADIQAFCASVASLQRLVAEAENLRNVDVTGAAGLYAGARDRVAVAELSACLMDIAGIAVTACADATAHVSAPRSCRKPCPGFDAAGRIIDELAAEILDDCEGEADFLSRAADALEDGEVLAAHPEWSQEAIEDAHSRLLDALDRLKASAGTAADSFTSEHCTLRENGHD